MSTYSCSGGQFSGQNMLKRDIQNRLPRLETVCLHWHVQERKNRDQTDCLKLSRSKVFQSQSGKTTKGKVRNTHEHT